MVNAERGFTLIELVIVVMLIAIATAITAPRMADMIGGARVRKSARDFCNLARLARSKAANEMTAYDVVLSSSKREMSVVKTGEDERPGSTLLRRELEDGVSVQGVKGGSSGGGDVRFEFKPDGTAEDGKAVFIDSTGRKLEVLVNPVSGKAKVAQ